MIRTRFLLVAAGGLASTFVLAGILLERPPGVPAAPKLACPALAPRIASADRIELAHAGQVLWLERRGASWGVARQGGYPAQPGRVEALVDTLLTVRLSQPAPGSAEATGPAGAVTPGPATGTSVRILGTSGATLCALVTGPGEAVRRYGDAAGSQPSSPVKLSAELGDWSQHTLPPLDPAAIRAVVDDAGLGAGPIEQGLSALPVSAISARPQVHLQPARTVRLALNDGTALLTVGIADGQSWLLVSGTSPWASQLAPYAFALPPDSPLLAS